MVRPMPHSWYIAAVNVIHEATAALPQDMPLDERKKIVDAAYPFGERSMFPYKMWLKARRQYLARYGYRVDTPLLDMLSPLDKAKRKAEARK